MPGGLSRRWSFAALLRSPTRGTLSAPATEAGDQPFGLAFSHRRPETVAVSSSIAKPSGNPTAHDEHEPRQEEGEQRESYPNKVAGPSLAKNDGMVAARNGSIRSIEVANATRRKPRSSFAIPLASGTTLH